jgi:hypothetical protein
LVFVTKSFTGLDRMREVMSKHSTSSSQNVPSFEFVENDNRIPLIATRPLDELQSALVAQFAGQSVEFKKLYEEHSVDAFVGFLRANYREAICNLMDAGSVTLSSRGKTVLTKPFSRMPSEAIIHFK